MAREEVHECTGTPRLSREGKEWEGVCGPTSEYLLVRQEPRASITGALVKFSDAISSMPRLWKWQRGGRLVSQ